MAQRALRILFGVIRNASAASLILCLAFLSHAEAGRHVERRILGFSPDGRYFAFEQFGRLDNITELAYSEISVIQADDNVPVPGTPIRKIMHEAAHAQDGNGFAKNLEIIRKAAADSAQKLLHHLDIAPRGYHLASNPMTETDAGPHNVRIDLLPITGHSQPIAFTLEEFPLPQAKDFTQGCDEPVKGFSLFMQQHGEPPVTIFKDTEISLDRGCVLSYAIADIFRLEETGPPHSYAILIRYVRADIEGGDARFLAIMRRLP